MRNINIRYPVDRYLIESSKKFEIVNILDEDLWKTEPALKPEDEIILRKLHEMLQSTADDLKLLAGELSKFHEVGVQVKTAPTPLDEEFNEKVHIEEIVNAKFHGYKIIDKSNSRAPEYKSKENVANDSIPAVISQKVKLNNTYVQEKPAPTLKKPVNRKLEITRPKVIQITSNQDSTKTEKLNNGKIVNVPTVAYNEYSHKYTEPKLTTPSIVLKVQQMPSINIRSELKEQKVLQLDIVPENKDSVASNMVTKNVAVIAIEHEIPEPIPTKPTPIPFATHKLISHSHPSEPKVRLISKMSTCDSSGSTNNGSSDSHIKFKSQKRVLRSPKTSARSDRKKSDIKKQSTKRSHLNLDEWRNKLNVVYGPARLSNTQTNKPSKSKSKLKVSPKRTNTLNNKLIRPSTLNNAEYIPYSKLTVGGVRASDIEREISEIPNKSNLPLSPILDRILSSRENSFSKRSPRKTKTSNGQKILSTSDENLLQEVIDIENTVGETLSKNFKSTSSGAKSQKVSSESNEAKDNESYDDDFEDEKSDHSGQSANQRVYSRHTNESNKTSEEENNLPSESDDHSDNENEVKSESRTSNANNHNLTYTKTSKLSFKNKIDIFEFVHEVDTQDSATQSNGKQKITPKETQTTPRSDRNVQPIHNDLWPSIDPNGQVEKMFKVEKEFIKQLIVDEYGDLLEKNVTKPSTSNEIENKKNVAASQKNTQTSPAHVKNVMTSPTRTKTRTTSPFTGLTVDHHTSPLIFVTNDDDIKINIEEEEDLASSINLSSPRFSLRLPGTSREVISNMAHSSRRTDKINTTEARKKSTETRQTSKEARTSALETKRSNTVVKKIINVDITSTSTSTREADSSDISSLGEVKLRRILGQALISSDSESVSSLSSKCSSDLQSGILPLRSEGEMSLGLNRKSNKYNCNKSEGEASFGML